MADEERVRLRSSLAELLSPATMSQAVRGTVTVHDEPVDGGRVKGFAGQDGSNAEVPADGTADEKILSPKNFPTLGAASEPSGKSPNPAEHVNRGGTRTWTGGLTTAPAALVQDGSAGQRELADGDSRIDQQQAPKPPLR